MAGLKTLGTTIKTSFLFSRPVVVSTGSVIEPILEQDEHSKSIKEHVAKEKFECDATNAMVVTNKHSSSTTPSTTPTSPINMFHTKDTTTSYVTPIMHSNSTSTGKDSVPGQMSSPNTTPLPTMPTVPSTTAGIEQHTPLTRMHSMHNTSTKYMDDSANSSGSKVRTKPVKRNSYFGSFIRALTASIKHTTCTTAEINKVNTVQQDYYTLNHSIQKSSSNNNKILPVAE